jgi:WD40 repeat protein
VRELTLPGSSVYCMCFAPDGRTLAVGGPEAVSLCDISTGTEVRTFEVAQAVRVEASPDGRYLAASTSSGVAFVFDLTDGSPIAGPTLPGAGLGEWAFATFLAGGRSVGFYTDSAFLAWDLSTDGRTLAPHHRRYPLPVGGGGVAGGVPVPAGRRAGRVASRSGGRRLGRLRGLLPA